LRNRFSFSRCKDRTILLEKQEKKRLFFRNRSRNRSHFPQPFPKRFLSFLLLFSWKISIFAGAFNKKEKEIWQNM